jgi:dipeptidyl aminopeptidase/acylaminoacyl peptidase
VTDQAQKTAAATEQQTADALASHRKHLLFQDSLLDFQWVADGRLFGYRLLTGPKTYDCWLVYTTTGEKRLVADSAALHGAWEKRHPDPAKRPAIKIDEVCFDRDGGLWPKLNGRWWKYQAGTLADAGNPPQEMPALPAMQVKYPFPHPQNSPDGHFRIFIKDQNLWVRDLKNNEEFTLTTDGRSGDAYEWPACWSGDSRHVLLYRIKRPPVRQITIVESSPKDRIEPKLHTINYAKPGDPLAEAKPWLIDVVGRKGNPVDAASLCPTPWSLEWPRWNPALGQFTFLYNQRGHQVLRVIGVDPATGKASCLLEEASKTFITYSDEGKCFYWPLPTGEMLWMSERSGWNHLWRHDPRTGQTVPVTSGNWVVDHIIHVDEATRQVWFRGCGFVSGENPYNRQLFRINFDGSGLVRLTGGNGDHDYFQFSPDFRTLVVRWSRPNQPHVHELRDGQTGRLICTLATADASRLAKIGWVTPEPFFAKGRDGQTDIWGIIIRPANFDPKRQYPVVESIYSGPQGHFTPTTFLVWSREQDMADSGFIVVRMDGMGTSGRSKAFQDVCWQNLKDAGFPDRKLWIQAAVKHCPQMDLDRIGIYGGSAGGQNAMRALLDHYPFYKVAVADCGCHDNRMDKIWWNEQFMGWPIGPHYEKSSNVVDARKLQGKLMLVVGEMDTNVDPASTMQVVNALVKASKPFDLLVIPGGGHCAGQSTPYAWQRFKDYFHQHLDAPAKQK